MKTSSKLCITNVYEDLFCRRRNYVQFVKSWGRISFFKVQSELKRFEVVKRKQVVICMQSGYLGLKNWKSKLFASCLLIFETYSLKTLAGIIFCFTCSKVRHFVINVNFVYNWKIHKISLVYNIVVISVLNFPFYEMIEC